MTQPAAPEYWASLLRQIRQTKDWNQGQLASEIGVSRETVSRWEQESKYPTLENQIRIGELAASLNVASVYGVSKVVEFSPFPMILADQNGFVLAASKSSGFSPGQTVLEQTPKEEQDNYIKFAETVSASGFWEQPGNTFEYRFGKDGHEIKAVLQTVGSRGHIFALVQKIEETR